MTNKAVRENERNEAIEHLRKLLQPGDTVYTILRHVSRSGMSRGIDVYYLSVETETNRSECQCDNCAVCHGEKVICGVCRMCTRCHEHALGCAGCQAGIERQVARPVWITGYVGKAIERPQSRKDWEQSNGLRVTGCGMDMGFSIVYDLSRVLFRDEYALNHKWL